MPEAQDAQQGRRKFLPSPLGMFHATVLAYLGGTGAVASIISFALSSIDGLAPWTLAVGYWLMAGSMLCITAYELRARSIAEAEKAMVQTENRALHETVATLELKDSGHYRAWKKLHLLLHHLRDDHLVMLESKRWPATRYAEHMASLTGQVLDRLVEMLTSQNPQNDYAACVKLIQEPRKVVNFYRDSASRAERGQEDGLKKFAISGTTACKAVLEKGQKCFYRGDIEDGTPYKDSTCPNPVSDHYRSVMVVPIKESRPIARIPTTIELWACSGSIHATQTLLTHSEPPI